LQLLAFAAWQQLQVYGPEKAAETLAEAARLAKETGYVRVLLDIPALAETVAGAGDAAKHAPAG
ncbi:MAG TPA: hypothetical protein PKD73_18900, partial [Burkholderiaceae bacterium]|nr:hypothetical protein [Burkholderiaceae bacterium]